LVVGCQCNNQL